MGNINTVIAGKYLDKELTFLPKLRVVCIRTNGYTNYKSFRFIIQNEIKDLNLIDTTKKTSIKKAAAGAALLGAPGVLLGMGKDEAIIEITWNDDTKSVIKTDKKMYEKILTSYYLECNKEDLISSLEESMKSHEEQPETISANLMQGAMFIVFLFIVIWLISSLLQ